MKEIKAYIRRDEVNPVVEKLHDAGAPGVAIIEIHPLDYGYETNPFAPHRAGLADRYRHLAVVKLEIMCRDVEARVSRSGYPCPLLHGQLWRRDDLRVGRRRCDPDE